MREAIETFNRIVDRVEARCLAADGPVTPTLKEITEKELAALWRAVQTIREGVADQPGASADGWLYHCPDTGTEWSRNHPIESGEIPDAEDVRPATVTALCEELQSAWEALAYVERRMKRQPDALAVSGRFAEYTTAELVGQLRMEARDKLSPDMTEFLTACADRLGALAGSGAGDGALREALKRMRDRDDRNGSLPEAYREIIDAALAANPSETGATSTKPVAWMRMNSQGTQSTAVTDVEFYADLWRSEGDTVVPLVPATGATSDNGGAE